MPFTLVNPPNAKHSLRENRCFGAVVFTDPDYDADPVLHEIDRGNHEKHWVDGLK